MLFRDSVEPLRDSGHEAVVLKSRTSQAALLLAPGLVGRVMCSTFACGDGAVNGWVNESAIQRGKVDPVFSNFGGEERFWFAPEGGQFGLMFGRAESKFSNYCVQPGMTSF